MPPAIPGQTQPGLQEALPQTVSRLTLPEYLQELIVYVLLPLTTVDQELPSALQ